MCGLRSKSDQSIDLEGFGSETALVRCHRQYLVNLKAIREIKLLDNGLAEMITHAGHKVPVSRRYLKEVKEMLGFY